MSYSAQNIRNVCLLGHGGNGKTSLAESMLSTAVAPIEYKGCKINILDTPGYF